MPTTLDIGYDDDHRKLGLVTNGALRPPAGRLALTVGISPYIRRLRERVGHDLVLLPSVAVLARDEDGRLLLVREAQTGLWQTIGDGEPRADGEETTDVAWFTTDQLADAALSEFTIALLGDPAVAILSHHSGS